jgi:molybdopterin/thiamine biosynthesis adenylyltransferase
MTTESSGARDKIRDRLPAISRKIKDPAGREVEVVEDAKVLEVAGKCGCSVHALYMEALNRGIYPYRYLRNREIISLQEQLQLAKTRVAVIGAGGLGGHIILLLARLGIGEMVVVDHDVFDETNLNRQALCSQQSLGKSKSEVAARVVATVNPGVEVLAHQVKLDSFNGAEILAGSDVLVDALDNVPDRFILEKVAKKLGVPLVHGALAGFEGQLMTILPEDPGLKHLYGNAGANGDESKRPEAVLGVPALMPALMATLQVMEVLKIILKRGRIFRNVMVHMDLETGRMNEFFFEDQ